MEQQLPDFVIAEALVRATREVPGVADVYGGPANIIATYGRGGRVPGIRVRTESKRLMVEVHIVARYAPNLKVHALANAVRKRIQQELKALNVDAIGEIDVVVEDIRIDTVPQQTEAT